MPGLYERQQIAMGDWNQLVQWEMNQICAGYRVTGSCTEAAMAHTSLQQCQIEYTLPLEHDYLECRAPLLHCRSCFPMIAWKRAFVSLNRDVMGIQGDGHASRMQPHIPL